VAAAVAAAVAVAAVDSQPEFTLHQNIRKVGVINKLPLD
jgi:hypothetical protein